MNVVSLVVAIIALVLCTFMYFSITHVPLHVAVNSRLNLMETAFRSRCAGDTLEQVCVNYSATRPPTLEGLIGGEISE